MSIRQHSGGSEMEQALPSTEPLVIEKKRVIHRRCPVCDRGHACFNTAIDLDLQIMESPREIAIGSVHRIDGDIVGSWRGIKTRIPDGTRVTVKNIHIEQSGGLRAMVELPDGDTQWISASLLGHPLS